MEIILLSIIAATSVLIIFGKIIGLARMIKYQVLVDVICTFGLPALFFGTFHGMAIAFLSGLIVTVVLYVLGKLELVLI